VVKDEDGLHHVGDPDWSTSLCPVGRSTTGLTAHELRADDPLARRDRLKLADLADRRWFQFPDGTDPIWHSYWNGGEPREGPVIHAVQECLQAVLWNGTVGIAPVRARPAQGAGCGAAGRHFAEPRGSGVERG